MKASKYHKQENHNILLLEVLNIDDYAIERRTLYPKRAVVLILSCLCPACVGHPAIVKAVK